MYEDELAAAYSIADEICKFFNIPIPKIVIKEDIPSLGECVDTTVYLKPGVARSRPEVVAHEIAHVSHVYYGIPCRTPECEAYAIIFENVWKASRGRSLKRVSCPTCGYPLMFQSRVAKCLKCGKTYLYNGGIMQCVVCGRPLETGPSVIRCSCGAVYRKAYRYPGSLTDFLLGTVIGYFVLPIVIPTVGELARKAVGKR